MKNEVVGISIVVVVWVILLVVAVVITTVIISVAIAVGLILFSWRSVLKLVYEASLLQVKY